MNIYTKDSNIYKYGEVIKIAKHLIFMSNIS